ncbi:hypothetical protein GIB67_036185 [Kingdonia uniflora]|uniref:Cellulose synthase-like protein E1 n=1 Tax=Kingdonia uniflora TaxID=39325 RepID=A0A7J7N986_9MAGN|nr:hypothetical protein GIB67_036185 [Kingdonia uniflora]
MKVELPGCDGHGGPLYIGTGCFHRRESLCGKKYETGYKFDMKKRIEGKVKENGVEVWLSSRGRDYGVINPMSRLEIDLFCPERAAFLGIAPTTLAQMLVQHKRWAEGDFQILLSKCCPFIMGHGRISLGLQWGTPSTVYGLLIACQPCATLFYHPFTFLRALLCFQSPWFIPYAFVIVAANAYYLAEFMWRGGTLKGLSSSGFDVTAKVSEKDVSERYEKEIMEFGSSLSGMFTIIATLALLNLFCLVGGLKRIALNLVDSGFETMFLQVLVCGTAVAINLPVTSHTKRRRKKMGLDTYVRIRIMDFIITTISRRLDLIEAELLDQHIQRVPAALCYITFIVTTLRVYCRYKDELPCIDIFVCTADPKIEPPVLAINTVLSVMAYNYLPEKLSVYLSDDGGSDLTFYALLKASVFSKQWIPFCKKFNIEPRSPAAYFSTTESKCASLDPVLSQESAAIKKLYKAMEDQIETATKLGHIPEHTGFSEWASVTSQRDHQSILQIIIDGRDSNAVDADGCALPTLVYLSREKRPNHPHNFKAGAMNALLRVSSKISNGQIILNVDCDMYSNNSDAVKDALCFFMDEQKGDEIAYVQFPQNFSNLTKNDIYGSKMDVITKAELPGCDGHGGPVYIGTGCFHRRESLCGKKYETGYKFDMNRRIEGKVKESVNELEETSKVLANCTYEEGTQWGKEMGLKYGCPVEDVITGLSIQCRGWKSIFFCPERAAFLGIAPITLAQMLVQHKRWAEGDFQILLSKCFPFIIGHGRISLGLQVVYSIYCLWAPNCLPTLCYLILPPLYLLKGIALFPKITSPWFIPYAFVIVAANTYYLAEFMWCGGTLKGWWNDQRAWMFKRTMSYLFAVIDTAFNLLGLSSSGFDVTAKVSEQDISDRYEQDIMEFGSSLSGMFTIIATLALLNLFCLVGGLKRIALNLVDSGFETMFLQVLVCGTAVAINLPVYQALFFRKDKGRLPISLAFKSFILALLACKIFLY